MLASQFLAKLCWPVALFNRGIRLWLVVEFLQSEICILVLSLLGGNQTSWCWVFWLKCFFPCYKFPSRTVPQGKLSNTMPVCMFWETDRIEGRRQPSNGAGGEDMRPGAKNKIQAEELNLSKNCVRVLVHSWSQFFLCFLSRKRVMAQYFLLGC